MVSAHPEKGPASTGRNTVTWEEYSIKRGEKKDKNSKLLVIKTKEGWFFFFFLVAKIKEACSKPKHLNPAAVYANYV